MVLQIGGPPQLPLPEDPEGLGAALPGAAPTGALPPGLPPAALEVLEQGGLEGPQDLEVPAPVVPEEEVSVTDPNKVDPIIATYKHPEMGPFLCANCIFFQEGNSCKIVSGYIDEAGICSNFTPPDDGVEDSEALLGAGQDQLADEPPQPELPPELPEGLPEGLPGGLPEGPGGPIAGLPIGPGGPPPGLV